jgi:hypothetical protein
LIKEEHLEFIQSILYPLWSISLSFLVGNWFKQALTGYIIRSLNPGTSATLSFLFGASIFFGVLGALKYQNNFFNQLMYSICSLELVLLIYNIGSTGSAIGVTLFLVILYPFIFFLEQITKLIGLLIDFLKLHFKEFVLGVKRLLASIANWYRIHIKSVWFVFSMVVAIGLYLITQNVFLSILAMLVIMIAFSPLGEKVTTVHNFKGKVIYFGTIYFTFMLFLFTFIEFKLWIVFLFVLLFFGGVLWAARYAEKLYGLSVKWRIGSALIAILDFMLFAWALSVEFF